MPVSLLCGLVIAIAAAMLKKSRSPVRLMAVMYCICRTVVWFPDVWWAMRDCWSIAEVKLKKSSSDTASACTFVCVYADNTAASSCVYMIKPVFYRVQAARRLLCLSCLMHCIWAVLSADAVRWGFLRPRLHDTAGCQTGWTTGGTTGCIIETNIQRVVL